MNHTLNHLTRYMIAQMALATALVFIVFFALFWLIQWMSVSQDARLPALTVWLLALLNTASMLAPFSPTMLFLGFLLSFGNMAARREVIALQALGASLPRLVAMVAIAWLVVSLIMLAFTELAAPSAARVAERLANPARAVSGAADRIWLKAGNRMIGLNYAPFEQRLQAATVYTLDDARITHWQAGQNSRDDNREVRMEGTTLVMASRDGATVRYVDDIPVSVQPPTATLSIPLPMAPEQLRQTPETLFIWQLAAAALRIGSENRQMDWGFVLANRLAAPFAALGLMLLFLPALLGSPRVVRLADRLFFGVLAGALYYLLDMTVGYGGTLLALPSVLNASLPAILLLSLGAMRLYQSR